MCLTLGTYWCLEEQEKLATRVEEEQKLEQTGEQRRLACRKVEPEHQNHQHGTTVVTGLTKVTGTGLVVNPGWLTVEIYTAFWNVIFSQEPLLTDLTELMLMPEHLKTLLSPPAVFGVGNLQGRFS